MSQVLEGRRDHFELKWRVKVFGEDSQQDFCRKDTNTWVILVLTLSQKVIARRHKFDFLETKWRVQIWHTLIQRLRLWDEINGREPLPFSQPLPTAIFSMVQILQVQISMVQIWLHLEGSRCKVKKIIQRLCCCWEWA